MLYEVITLQALGEAGLQMAAAFEAPRVGRSRPGWLTARRGRPREFLAALESASRDLDDPVAKLRYIRESLARYEGIERAVGS